MFIKLGVRELMATSLCCLLAAAATANPHPLERGALMTQHLHEEVRAARSVGTLAQDKVLHFDMLLPVGEPEKLETFLADVYNPHSASYRHFVTPSQFTARFGPSQAAWNELLQFAKQSGFTIVSGSRDEMDLRLAGTVRSIEAAFQVKMRLYNHPTESRTYYSPDTEPTVPMQAAVWHISGLDNFALPHARVQSRSGTTAKPLTTTGACPGNSYCGSDMRSAYYGSGALTGAGQSIGLVEFYGYDSADLNTYFSTAGQVNAVPVNGISTDGTSVSCVYSKGCDDTEQTLDMTQALGMAPGLAQLNVYVGSSDTAILSAMSVPPAGSVTGKVDAQLSCSWGWGPSDPATDDPLFKKFAAQGQSFFTAAGDSAAYTSSSQYVYPADDVNVTVVGGSDLSTAGPSGPWVGETAWSDGGGGYFAPDNIAIPAWQTAAISSFDAHSSRAGSSSLRNSPDVAAEANFDFYVCADQQSCVENRYGGTSFAAPMWAGYMALVNQQAVQNGQSSVGFLNPTLYAIGAGSGYAQAFHDITAGSNGFNAVTGYDLATGWGSPNGTGLITALVGAGTPGFTLATSASTSVPAGGSGTLKLTSTVTGGFNSAISLSASGQPSGVTVSFSPASITGAGSSTVSIQAAANVPAGNYTITLTGTSAASGSTAPPAPSVVTVTLNVTTANFALAARSSALTVTVGATGADTVSASGSGGFNSAITLSAAGQPSGVTVRFSAASIKANSAATVSFQVATTAAPGVYPIAITGTSGSLVQSTTVNLTIPTPTFSLAASAGSVAVTEGLSGTLRLSTAAAGGFAAPVQFSASGQPSGMSVSFSPATVTGAGTSTVSFLVGATVAAGSYPVMLTGSSGSLQQSVTVTVNVATAAFSITPSATTLTLLQGATGSVTLTGTVTGVLNGPIALSLSGAPAGVTASLSSSSLTPPGSVTISVASGAVAAGSYPLFITGVGDNITHTASVTLIVASVAKPTFMFAVGATALTVTHGTSGGLSVQTALTGATVPVIALSVSGLPSGVTATFGPSTLTGAGMSNATLTAASSAHAGTYVITVSASAGGNTQSSTVSLTVN